MSSFKKGKFSTDKQSVQAANEGEIVDSDQPNTTDEEMQNNDGENIDANSPTEPNNDVDETNENGNTGENTNDDDNSDVDDFEVPKREHDDDINDEYSNATDPKLSTKIGLTPADIKAKQLIRNLAREKKEREEKRRLREEKIQKKLMEEATADMAKLIVEKSELRKEEKRKQLSELPKIRKEKKKEEEEKIKYAQELVKNCNKEGYKYKKLQENNADINQRIKTLEQEDKKKKEEAIIERIYNIREKDHRVDIKRKETLDKVNKLPNIHCDKSVIVKFKDLELEQKEKLARDEIAFQQRRKEGLKILEERRNKGVKIDPEKAKKRKEFIDRHFTKPKQRVDIVDPRPWRNPPNIVPENPIPMEKQLTPHQKDMIEIQRKKEIARKANEYLRYQAFQREEMNRQKQEELYKKIHANQNRSDKFTPDNYNNSDNGDYYDENDYQDDDNYNDLADPYEGYNDGNDDDDDGNGYVEKNNDIDEDGGNPEGDTDEYINNQDNDEGVENNVNNENTIDDQDQPTINDENNITSDNQNVTGVIHVAEITTDNN